MRPGSRLQLKCPRGWFAAGREVGTALQLLSDATFKLFVWLCLHAERSRGTVSATPGELARTLRKKEDDICLALEELQRQSVCRVTTKGVIEIRERFWPYQRTGDFSRSEKSQHYVAEVKRLFLQRRCVQSSFTAADEKLALSLFRRGIPLLQVERAILLGAVRKYSTVLQNGPGSPISSLHYFANLFEEVQGISDHYWPYVAHKVQTFEQTWGAARKRRDLTPDEQNRDTCRSTESGEASLKPS